MSKKLPNDLKSSLHLEADLSNSTRLKSTVFVYEWCIENFGDFLERKYEIPSPSFTPDSKDQSEWKLVLFTEHSYPKGAHVAVSLVKISDDRKPYGVRYKVCIVGDALNVQPREKTFRFPQEWDECVIISHIELIERKLMQDNNLTLRCEMDLLLPESPSEESVSSAPNNKEYVSNSNDLSNNASPDSSIVEHIQRSPNASPKICNNLENSYNLFDDKLESDKNVCDTQDSLNSLSDDFRGLYISKGLSDFIVFCDGIPMCAHKAVLTARSDYFKMLCNEKEMNNSVNISDVKSAVVESVLYYIYTGKTRHLTFEFALDMLSAAKKFRLQHLQRLLIDFLKPTITTKNVTDVFQLSKKLKLEDLQQVCIKFIDSNHSPMVKPTKPQLVVTGQVSRR